MCHYMRIIKVLLSFVVPLLLPVWRKLMMLVSADILTNLVLSGMFLLLHFGQGELQVINVLLELRAFILQFPLLGSQLSVYLLLILQSLSCLLDFGLQLDLTLDESLTPLLSIIQILSFLFDI